jgi:hypothetical protein
VKLNLLFLLPAALACLFTMTVPTTSQTWTQTSAPITNWTSIASSADGSKLVAVAGRQFEGFVTQRVGPIYASTNAGSSWTATSAPMTNWNSVASSADGTRLVAVAAGDSAGGLICTSDDSGATWRQTRAPLLNWSCVASSADGRRLVAGSFDPFLGISAPIYASPDAGATWHATASSNYLWDAVASSADGNQLVAAADGWRLYTSMDSGVTWTFTFTPTTPFWQWGGLACSADGAEVAAVLTWVTSGPSYFPGPIYFSTNSGAAWTEATAPHDVWRSVASSADGRDLVAAGTDLQVSTNGGATWMPTLAPTANWQGVASSADGTKLAAVVNGGGIYVYQSTPAPRLSLTPSGSNLMLSWIVPSMDFVLQESSTLATNNWTDVTNTPALNLTNLQCQALVPPLTGTRFYRLKH